MNDNSKERIKFACKELEDALALFGDTVAVSEENSRATGAGAIDPASSDQRQEKVAEIKRQLRSIREQLDNLS